MVLFGLIKLVFASLFLCKRNVSNIYLQETRRNENNICINNMNLERMIMLLPEEGKVITRIFNIYRIPLKMKGTILISQYGVAKNVYPNWISLSCININEAYSD